MFAAGGPLEQKPRDKLSSRKSQVKVEREASLACSCPYKNESRCVEKAHGLRELLLRHWVSSGLSGFGPIYGVHIIVYGKFMVRKYALVRCGILTTASPSQKCP